MYRVSVEYNIRVVGPRENEKREVKEIVYGWQNGDGEILSIKPLIFFLYDGAATQPGFKII